MDTQMKKGILEMCILFRLKDEPLYGYELMKSVRQVFPDVYEGSFYTILRRLKATGYTCVTFKSRQPAQQESITESPAKVQTIYVRTLMNGDPSFKE